MNTEIMTFVTYRHTDRQLLLYINHHHPPHYHNDSDLPEGDGEHEETLLEALQQEVAGGRVIR